jgi:hypothetical protein
LCKVALGGKVPTAILAGSYLAVETIPEETLELWGTGPPTTLPEWSIRFQAVETSVPGKPLTPAKINRKQAALLSATKLLREDSDFDQEWVSEEWSFSPTRLSEHLSEEQE